MFYSFVGSSLLVCQMYNSINEKGLRQRTVMLDLDLYMPLI